MTLTDGAICAMLPAVFLPNRDERLINETPPPGMYLGGRYRLIEAIGRGGMARVFRAVDETLEREVAVKLLREPLESEVVRFEREARLMAKLRHPAVVKVYGFGVMDDGRPYLVLELVDEAT
ncbi:MAG: protein kinase, partial [bacterium]